MVGCIAQLAMFLGQLNLVASADESCNHQSCDDRSGEVGDEGGSCELDRWTGKQNWLRRGMVRSHESPSRATRKIHGLAYR